jgi:hypothetical protein
MGGGSRLAGSRPDDGGRAGGVAGPAVRAGRRPVRRPQEYRDPESCAPPPGEDELTADELAGIAAAAGDEMLALDAASTGRRGPGQAGSARVCAWDRVEAHAAARKLVAIAEMFRRNPEDGFEPEPGRMPAVVHEFTRDQLAFALGESRAAADWLLTVAWHLATRLDGTLGALRDGIITRGKAGLIVRLAQYPSDEEAATVEAKIPGRAGRRHGRAARPRLPGS